MLRNYLAAALRNLVRNRLYAAINITGVTLGFVAVLLIALFVRDELTFDRFIPGHEDVYRMAKTLRLGGTSLLSDGSAPAEATWIKNEIPEVRAVVRLWPEEHGVRRQDVEANEVVVWADAGLPDVFPLRTIQGDLKIALSRPDGAAITRRIARKYFGRDDVLGETLELDRKGVLQIAAVLEDLPTRSHMNLDIVASNTSAAAPLAAYLRSPAGDRIGLGPVFTYMRIAPGTFAAVEEGLKAMTDRHVPAQPASGTMRKGSELVNYTLQPLDSIHMLKPNDRRDSAFSANLFKPAGDAAAVAATAVTGGLILLVALANFINLMTARAGRRAVEVGVRKTAGAQRPDLLAQFMGESFAYVAASLVAAIAAVELALPAFNGFLGRAIVFDWLRDPALRGGILLTVVVTGALGGLYPSLVLAAFRPAAVLRGGRITSSGSGALRKLLVIGQFTILIALMAGTLVIARQTTFAMTQSLRFESDQVVFIDSSCRDAFKDQVKALPGVKGAACASGALLGGANEVFLTSLPDGATATIEGIGVDSGLLDLYGVKPIAGRMLTLEESTPPQPGVVRHVVVNETTVRRLGFPSADAAIGKPPVALGAVVDGPAHMGPQMEIVGVVPDFAIRSVREAIPMIAFGASRRYSYLMVKIDGAQTGAVLQGIDQAWQKLGTGRPINRQFLNQYVEQQYLSLTRQTEAFTAFAATAIIIAALGLFGLSVFTAERRTKEIGIRKAMGARRADIIRLLLWEFIRPVIWATAIAWPLGYLALRRWLDGFAYRIEIEPGIFIGASVLAMAIASATIIIQIIRVARAEPVSALRYE